MADKPLASWCMTCGTAHTVEQRCPGDIQATGEERAGWTVLAKTPTGQARIQVLLAPCHDIWRARVRTFPNVLWLVPGGPTSLKFIDRTRADAERQAIEFVQGHCAARGFATQSAAEGQWAKPEHGKPAERKIRFLPVRFGLGGPSEAAGTGNLSETGMFVVTDSPVDPGVRIRMVLQAEKVPIPLLGQVVWNRMGHEVGGVPGMGVQLLQPPAPYLRYVRNLNV